MREQVSHLAVVPHNPFLPKEYTHQFSLALAWRVEALHSSAMENFLARSRRSAGLRAHFRKAEIDTARLEKRQHSKQGAGYTSRGVTSVVAVAVAVAGSDSG